MKTYAILKPLNADMLFNAERNMYNAMGNHIRPQWINKNDKYILFEKTMNEDGSEYFSNAWSSSDRGYITAKMERFDSYFDYLGKDVRIKSFTQSEIESNKLPTCMDYAQFLAKICAKNGLTIDNARKLYGKFTYSEWKSLLNA